MPRRETMWIVCFLNPSLSETIHFSLQDKNSKACYVIWMSRIELASWLQWVAKQPKHRERAHAPVYKKCPLRGASGAGLRAAVGTPDAHCRRGAELPPCKQGLTEQGATLVHSQHSIEVKTREGVIGSAAYSYFSEIGLGRCQHSGLNWQMPGGGYRWHCLCPLIHRWRWMLVMDVGLSTCGCQSSG